MGPLLIPFLEPVAPSALLHPETTVLPSDFILGNVSNSVSSSKKSSTGVTAKPVESSMPSDFSSLFSGQSSVPPINYTSDSKSAADGRSGNATSTATFGDFIVNGSKGDITNILLVIAGAALVYALFSKRGKK